MKLGDHELNKTDSDAILKEIKENKRTSPEMKAYLKECKEISKKIKRK